MRAVLFATALSFLAAGAARAADKPAKAEAAKTEKSDKKAGEVTLSGEMVCAKCTLNESKKCQNVLKVSEGTKETKYYLVQNEAAKSNHGHVCSAPAKATVTGTVGEEGGKKTLTASSIKFE